MPPTYSHLVIATSFDVVSPLPSVVAYKGKSRRFLNANYEEVLCQCIDTGTDAVYVQVPDSICELFTLSFSIRVALRRILATSLRANDAVLTLLLQKMVGYEDARIKICTRSNQKKCTSSKEFTSLENSSALEMITRALVTQFCAHFRFHCGRERCAFHARHSSRLIGGIPVSVASPYHARFDDYAGVTGYRPKRQLFRICVSCTRAAGTVQIEHDRSWQDDMDECEIVDIVGKCRHPCVNLIDATFLSSLPHGPTLIANASDAHPLTAVLPITPETTSTFNVPFVRLLVLGAVTFDVEPVKQECVDRLKTHACVLHEGPDAAKECENVDPEKGNEVVVMAKSAWIRPDNVPVPVHFEESCIPLCAQNVPLQYRSHPFWTRFSATSLDTEDVALDSETTPTKSEANEMFPNRI